MMRRRLLTLSFSLALGACTAATPLSSPTGTPTGTISGSAQPSASPTKPPPPTAREVVYAAEDALWIYDVKTDANRQVAQGKNIRMPRWVGPTQVSYVAGERGARNDLYLVDLKTRSASALFTVDSGIHAYAWSPDRQTVAYVTTDRYSYPRVVFKTIGGDGAAQPVATLARAYGRGLEASDQQEVSFSRDGQRVLIAYTPADGERAVPDDQSQVQIRTIDGELDYAPDHATGPTMAVWTPNGSHVYFRSKSGLRVWKAGAAASQAARGGVGWFNPSASPDGAYFAFDTGVTSTSVKVRTYAVADGRKMDLTPAGYFHPSVAHPRTVWAQRVTPCRPNCLFPVVPAPEVWAFDVQTKKSKKLALPTLVDVDVRFG